MPLVEASSHPAPGRRSGRPRRDEGERITRHIVDVATRLFFEGGYEATSVDLIAAEARVSKQTFYARFGSKEALLARVVRTGVDTLLAPLAAEAGERAAIDATLRRIGFALSKRAREPASIAMDRLVAAGAQSFPQMALAYHDNAFAHPRQLIAQVFEEASRDGQVRAADPGFMAEQFLHAVVNGPVRAMVMSGRYPSSDDELRDAVGRAVALFLDGSRGPPPPPGAGDPA